MKKEIEELRRMIISVKSDNISQNTINSTVDKRNRKGMSNTQRIKEGPNKYFKKLYTNNSKFQEICHLIDINVGGSTKRTKKFYSINNPKTVSSINQYLKANKQISSLNQDMNLYSTTNRNTHSSDKIKYQLERHIQSKGSFNTNRYIQSQKLHNRASIPNRYSSYLTSNDFYCNENKNNNNHQNQGVPLNNWFKKQQEKYKNVFYQEKTNNIRNLVSFTDNKEHRITNTYDTRLYTNTNSNSIIIPKNYSRESTSREKSLVYCTELDNFSNKLFKKEPIFTQENEPKYYITTTQGTSGNTSFKKDSLITNYNK